MDSQLSDIVARTVDGVVLVDDDGRLTYANARAAEHLGRPLDALVGHDYRTALPELVGGAFVEACLRAVREQHMVRAEYRHLPTDRWFEVRIYPTHTGLTIFFTDVSSRRRTEEELRETEARLVRAQAVANIGSWELDLGASEMWASEEAFRIYGVERTSPRLPFEVARAVPLPDDRPRLDDALHALLTEGRPYDLEYRIRRGDDGTQRVIHSRADLVRDDAGRPVKLVGTIQDVTDRVTAERERARLAAAIGQTSDAVVVQLGDGTITYVNRAFCSLYGYEPDEVLGRTTALIEGAGAGGPDGGVMQRVLRGQSWTGDLANRRRDGSTVEIAATVSPVTDERGQVGGIVQVHRDVTRERLLEHRINEVARLEAVGQLAGGVAHDFNNVLTAVRGYAEMLLTQANGLDDGARDDLAEIVHAADRAAALTRQLLAFGRRQVLDPRVLDLAEVVEAIAPMLRRLLGENVSIVLDAPYGLGPIRADPAQLDQILVNLAVNARDAMPDGGVLTIGLGRTIRERAAAPADDELAPGPYLLLTVSDTGTGMDEATLERIFEPFFTTKGLGRGTGMGLATVYGIVRQSGCSIDVESRVGVGTTFRIGMPIVDAPVPAASQPVAASRRAGSGTVLIVEDEAAVRRLVARVLAAHGYAVIEAAHGQEALDLVSSAPVVPDLVVTDLVMPVMSGRTLADRVRAEHPEVRVVFMSGYAEDIGFGGTLPDDVGFLAKPFTSDQLLDAVSRAMGDHWPG